MVGDLPDGGGVLLPYPAGPFHAAENTRDMAVGSLEQVAQEEEHETKWKLKGLSYPGLEVTGHLSCVLLVTHASLAHVGGTIPQGLSHL